MRVWWMLIILLGCRLSYATESQCTCSCNEQLISRGVPANSSAFVFVPCPNETAEDVIFNILKDQEVIYNYTCSRDKKSQNCETPSTRLNVQPHKNKENIFDGFTLAVAIAKSHEKPVYRCQSTVMYPPPLKRRLAQMIQVFVEGEDCLCNEDKPNLPECKQDTRDTQRFLWIWITVVALLSTYSVTVTILALVSWLKLRMTDSQSDYMNTKPRAPKDRRKKRGVQNPIPRHF